MFLLHYILPFIIFEFYKNNKMLFGLLIANLIDLDHIYLRLVGKISFFESACNNVGSNCSFGMYPLHSIWFCILGIFLALFLLFKNKNLKLIGWIGIGIIIHLFLDILHYLIGFGI